MATTYPSYPGRTANLLDGLWDFCWLGDCDPEKVEPEVAAAVCINGESLVDEVKRLLEAGCFGPVVTGDAVESPNQARSALGYKQLLAWLQGTDEKIGSLDEAFEKTKVLTRRFAKQQRTWLKRFTETRWVDGQAYSQSPDKVLDELVAALGD